MITKSVSILFGSHCARRKMRERKENGKRILGLASEVSDPDRSVFLLKLRMRGSL